jgi:hypothetical protein
MYALFSRQICSDCFNGEDRCTGEEEVTILGLWSGMAPLLIVVAFPPLTPPHRMFTSDCLAGVIRRVVPSNDLSDIIFPLLSIASEFTPSTSLMELVNTCDNILSSRRHCSMDMSYITA